MATATLPQNDASTSSIKLPKGFTLEEMSRLLVPQLPDGVDPTQMKLAYGRRAIPKLLTEFPSSSLKDRQKSLVFLANLLHNPENISQALDNGVVILLIGCLKDKDLCIRQKATESMAILAGYAHGRTALIVGNALMALSKLFNDACDLVRFNVHTVFARVTTQHDGVSSLLLFNLLVPLVKKLQEERMDIEVLILTTIHECIRMGNEPWIPGELVTCNAMQVFTDMIRLKDTVTEVKVAASQCIMMLSFHKVGKELATKSETILIMIELLYDKKSQVRAAAAGALMAITVDCEAKKIMVRENAVTKLVALLDDKNMSVLLNVVKCITNVAEDYRGRFQLHACVTKLETFFTSNNQQLSEAAKKAVQVITWRP